MDIEEIRKKVYSKEYIISEHAERERQAENIELKDIREAIFTGEILEDYPNDPRGPSCLVLGYAGERSIHIVCGWNKYDWLIIITVYIPVLPKWITSRKRGERRE